MRHWFVCLGGFSSLFCVEVCWRVFFGVASYVIIVLMDVTISWAGGLLFGSGFQHAT